MKIARFCYHLRQGQKHDKNEKKKKTCGLCGKLRPEITLINKTDGTRSPYHVNKRFH